PASTQPASTQRADATTKPTTQAAKKKFPTAAELAKQITDKKKTEENKLQVAYFDLTSGFTEKPADFTLFSEPAPTLRDLMERIGKARDDKDVKACLFYLGAGSGLNLSQANEVRDGLVALRRAGKKTFVYADTYDTVGYTLASGATDVCLLPGGEVFLPGIGFETMFYKGTFDKLGVKADYVQIGEYKGAEEPFTRTAPSDELKGELNKLVDSYFKQITDSIAKNRNLKTEDVKRSVDNAILSAKVAESAGWVDHLVDADGLRPLIKQELGGDIRVTQNYGVAEKDNVDFSNPFAILSILNKKEPVSDKPKVAVVYAEGTIVDGGGGSSLMGGHSIGSEEIRKAMRLASRDETVKAIVIRIDSPGGSALASEAMWQAVRRVEHDKPVIISVGSMAASGGYYLASAGDWIVADPTAIVGSIGVVGGKFVLSGLYDKLGLTTMTFSRGQNADLFSSTTNFSDRQKRMVTTWMKNTYDQFTDRVMTTRSGSIKDIDQVARGRIFLAADAKDLGMVDQIGGLEAAINIAAERAELKAGDYDVKVLPQPSTFADILVGKSAGDASGGSILPKIQISADSLLRSLPATLRTSLGQQIDLMHVLENRPVALMSPYVLTVK
ncbi:MAG: signal peptide peptidase SppA, type, partial [Phycisphaerales bacterium]|nr:signal peptide peptidase SppA, type [Phycisphaerales bacterium]